MGLLTFLRWPYCVDIVACIGGKYRGCRLGSKGHANLSGEIFIEAQHQGEQYETRFICNRRRNRGRIWTR